MSATIAATAGAGKATQEIWGEMRDSSWEGLQQMYEKGEISKEQIEIFATIRNLTDEEWSQIKEDYLDGIIGKDEFEQIKQIRQMPEEWTTAKNGIKGITYGVANGVWEGVQWYVGGKFAQWKPEGVSKILSSVVRVGYDTAFNAMDTPYRTLLDMLMKDKDLAEAWNDRGGSQAMLTDIGIGLIGSIGGEVFDSVKQAKNPKVELTMDDKIEIAKNDMKKYFNDNSKLGITEEKLTEAFESITACENMEAFTNIARECGLAENVIDFVNAFYSPYYNTVVLKPTNEVETIVHEINHYLGSTGNRGIDEACTESLALKISGVEGFGKTAYDVNVRHLNRIEELLKKAGYDDVIPVSYYTNNSTYLENTINNIYGHDNFYNEITKYMDIADGCGDVKDKVAIKQADIYVEKLIDLLENKIIGG